MHWWALDTETWLIAPGRLAPGLVCCSLLKSGGHPSLLAKPEAVKTVVSLLENPEVGFVGQNIAFDWGVLIEAGVPATLVWDAYEAGRIRDTRIHSQLIHIANGTLQFDPEINRPPRHSLAALAERFLGKKMEGKKGPDVWRLRYRELDGVPVADYPSEAREYALEDARTTMRVWKAQCHYVRVNRELEEMPDLGRQCSYAWVLHLLGAWGLRTDPEAVGALESSLFDSVGSAMTRLKVAGLYREKGTKDLKAVRLKVEEALGPAAPRTPTGAVSTSVETLQSSGDPLLRLLASISNDQKLLSTYVPMLKKGTQRPLNPRYGLVASGRTSSSKPNIQNQPRRGGARECFVPRDGCVFVCADYHVAELCGLAQVLLDLFGESEMARALQEGRELHLETAAGILGISYEEAVERYRKKDLLVKSARQLAKAANFGYPGGLGPESFQGLERYPEVSRYFVLRGERSNLGGGAFTATQHRSGRLRGGCSYTAGCNTYFQGLVADGAKLALWKVARECYLDSESPLYGSRPVAFVHDEIILESPHHRAAGAAKRLSEAMEEGMRVFVPDIPVRAEAHLMGRWYKDAEPRFNTAGELVPWTPESKDGAQEQRSHLPSHSLAPPSNSGATA